VLAANWRCNEGELDLVLGGPGEASYVFCEVKARSSSSFGTGLDAVTVLKQRRVRRLAVRWLAERRTRSERARKSFRPLRFDVAAVSVGTEGELVVEVLEGSF